MAAAVEEEADVALRLAAPRVDSLGRCSGGGSGLAAVRCGDYKAHFYTQGDYAIAGGRSKSWGKGGKQNPPLLFNLTADPTGAPFIVV